MNITDVNWLKKNHTKIHYFGLGFVQLKIDEFNRMHFYTKELPALTTSNDDIHNHRYGFTSTIIKGKFEQTHYLVVPGDTHIKEEESCEEGVEVTLTPEPCSVQLMSIHKYTTGSEYFLHHSVFHSVYAEDCITYLYRSPYKKEFAEVVRGKDAAKLCLFSKKVEESKLWEIVAEMLKDVEV